MKRKYTIRFLLFNVALLFYLHVNAQINNDGIPFITNYAPRIYNADEANWSVVKDSRGIIYFGNSEFILEYDGQSWRKIEMPGQTFVLSLAKGADGTIYAGGINDFGHLVVDSLGQLKYESLSYLVDEHINITRVWKIYSYNDKIYFCTFQYIFIYNPLENTINSIELPKDSFFSFLVDERLFTGNPDLGLVELKNSEFREVKGGGYFIDKDIFTILPWSEEIMLIYTAQKGLCLFNSKKGKVYGFDFNENAKKTNLVLKESALYAGLKINDSLFAFGTQLNGVFIVDKNGSIVSHFNEQYGLQNEVVSNLYYSGEGSDILWLTLSNGISSVNISSPVRRFGSESGINGAIYDIAEHKGNDYVATLQGVVRKDYLPCGRVVFEDVKGLSGERAYTIESIITPDGEELLVVAGTRDVFEIKDNRSYLLFSNIEVFELLQSRVFPDRIYVATNRGLRLIMIHENQLIFDDKEEFALNNETITEMTEDKHGNIWCEALTGTYMVEKDGSVKNLPETIKGVSGTFFDFNDDLFFVSKDKAYKYSYAEQDFHLFSPLNELYFEKGKQLKRVFPLDNGLLLAFYAYENHLRSDLMKIINDSWFTDTLSLRIIPPVTINAAIARDHFIMAGSTDGLFVYNNQRKKDFQRSFNTLIRSVVIGTDSLVYKGGDSFFKQRIDEKSAVQIFHAPLKYAFNNITITYSAPFFENEGHLVYSSWLEGFDQDWSSWSIDGTRSYTNLKEGNYRFHVKARNLYGTESRAAIFEFSILPPWYRTWWAYIIYVILGLVIIAASVLLYTRKLQRDKKRLEEIVRERTAEILEKNKEIEQKNKSITDSIRYAKRIQTAVLPNKQTSNIFDYFIYFKPRDIVSGDFYWIYHFEEKNKLVVAAADCTGHGVPGAFMSMLGTAFLNEIVAKEEFQHSDQILNVLRDYVINALKQGVKDEEKDEHKDGMDIGLVVIDLKNKELEYSGANNPMWFFRNGDLTEYKPNRMPIGLYRKQDVPFSRANIKLKNGDIFYLFSDGYTDQFGGKEGRKYTKKRFKDLLSVISNKPIYEQKRLLEQEMTQWSKLYEQIDDQIIIGMRVMF